MTKTDASQSIFLSLSMPLSNFVHRDNHDLLLLWNVRLYIQMERAESLVALDREICNYHLRNNYSKKDNLFCYQPDRAQITNFYSSMAEHFYQANLRSPQHSPRRTRTIKTRSQTQEALRDPMLACLPRNIPQDNLIDPGHAQTGMNAVPMFSEVEASKKQKYLIAREIRQLLGHDIRQMQSEKQDTAFRRRFPSRQAHGRTLKAQEESTQVLIKEFNRLLIKYKNNALNLETPLALLEKENHPCFTPDGTADQQFKILNLFKKLYLETKSQDINQHLINYLLKFHYSDKLTKKLRTKLCKPNVKATPVQPKRESHTKVHPTDTLKGSKATSQASIRSNIKESNKSPPKSSHFKPGVIPSSKKRTLETKQIKKIRSRTTHQLKLKL